MGHLYVIKCQQVTATKFDVYTGQIKLHQINKIKFLTLYCHCCIVASLLSKLITSHAAKHRKSNQIFYTNEAKHAGSHVYLKGGADVEEIVIHYGSAVAVFPDDVGKGCGLGGASEGDEVTDDC